MKLRIKYFSIYKTGYVVQIQKSNWFGRKYWTHFISVAGMDDKPWFHSSYEHAETNMLNKIKWDCITESYQ